MEWSTSTRCTDSAGDRVTTCYELDCTDCPFQTTVVGEFTDVIEAIDAHRAEQKIAPTDHFVNVRRLD